MGHLKSFFFNEQRQEVHANLNFLFVLGFQEKANEGRGWDLGTYFFKKTNPVVIKIMFFNKTLKFIGLLLYP